jgi:hypothetical protein
MGCELAQCYEVIRALIAQRRNPQRDAKDNEEYDRAIKSAQIVLPEFCIDEPYNYSDEQDV